MTRLKSKLLSFNAQKAVPTKIYSPANCEELRIPFKTDKVAKVVGKLASIAPPVSRSLSSNGEEAEAVYEEDRVEMISGVLVQNDFKISLMAPEDLKEYAGLTTTTILCRQHLTLSAAGIDLIRWALEGTFGAITESKLKDAIIEGKESKTNGNGIHDDADEEISRTQTTFTVMDCVNVLVKNGGRVEVEWEGNVINDGIADAVLAVLFTVESSPAAVKRTYPSRTPPPSISH
jgi:cleavage and polyadenylation specificity factor subunit 3